MVQSASSTEYRLDPCGAERLEIRIYRNLEELQTVRNEWRDLLRSYPTATTFSTPEWLVTWWQHFGGQQELLVLGFFETGDRLVGLAPLSLSDIRVKKVISLRVLRLMGDGSQDSDNLDLPVRPGYEQRFAASFHKFLMQERSWDVSEFNTTPSHSPGLTALRNLLRDEKWVTAQKQTAASEIALPSTWEEYLHQLSSEDQKNLVRYARRNEKRYAVRMFRCEREAELGDCLEAMFAHHQARWEAVGQHGSFGSKERRAFYYELSRQLLMQGRLDLWALEFDGRVVAAQFGFRYGNTVFQLQEGNDPKHASDRVGFVLRGHVMKELITEGVRTYDFLGGEPGYKAKWGAQPKHYLNLTFAKPLTAGAAYIQAQQYGTRGKSWLRRNLPASAWAVLHKTNVALKPRSRPNGNIPSPRKPPDSESADEN